MEKAQATSWYVDAVDARPLAFLRICFGFLMIVYSASKCTDDLANKKVDDMTYPFEHRIPTWLHELSQAFPYYSNSHLYWHLHAPLMLLSAAGMAMAFGPLSRLSCIFFAVLKIILTLQDQTNYNNHEYLYAIIALVMGLLGGHDACLSFLGKAALSAASPLQASCGGEDEENRIHGGDGDNRDESTQVWTSLFMSLGGAMYMALNNAVYGIAGHIAWTGVCLLLLPGVVLLLGRKRCPHPHAGIGNRYSSSSSSRSKSVISPTVNKVLRRRRMSIAASMAMGAATDANQGSATNNTDNDGTADCSKSCEHMVSTIPYWHVLFLRIFFSTVYLFAGFAKTDFDWCSGMTVVELFRLWTGPTASALVRDTILKISGGTGSGLGSLLVSALVYGGLCLDLGCAIFLNVSHYPTKMMTTLLVSSFHLLNHTNFVIETFPWVMLCALAVHHDAVWMDHACAVVHMVLYKFMYMKEMLGVSVRVLSRLLVPVMVVLLLLHLIIPLPCALYTVMDDGSLVWGSQCSFFRWRMMTRSVRTISSRLRFRDPNTGRVDNVPMISTALYPDVARVRECTSSSSLERYGFERNQALNRFLQEAGSYEDRVAYIVDDALQRVLPTSPDVVGAAPQIYADVWIEVNGPPVQRFIDSTVDLASKNARLASNPGTRNVNVKSIFQNFMRYFEKPAPLAPWVLPRLVQYRTPDWIQRYRTLEGLVAQKHAELTAGANGSEDRVSPPPKPQVVFLVDHGDQGLLRLDSRYYSDDDSHSALELVLLSGTAEIVNLDELMRVTVGMCVKVQGAISLRTICSQTDERSPAPSPSLWMIVSHATAEIAHGGSRVIGNGGQQRDGGAIEQQPEWLAVGYSSIADSDETAKTFNYCVSIP